MKTLTGFMAQRDQLLGSRRFILLRAAASQTNRKPIALSLGPLGAQILIKVRFQAAP
jgi:hypothetical protein